MSWLGGGTCLYSPLCSRHVCRTVWSIQGSWILIQGSDIVVSLNSRLDSNKEERLEGTCLYSPLCSRHVCRTVLSAALSSSSATAHTSITWPRVCMRERENKEGVCDRERESAREECVCVREREKAREREERARVCVCEREREREMSVCV